MAKIGRNDPCPCGSGKKYKKCCLSRQEDEKKLQRIEQKTEENLFEDLPASASTDMVNEYDDDDNSADVYPDEIEEGDLFETNEQIAAETDFEPEYISPLDEPPPEISDADEELINQWYKEYHNMKDPDIITKHLLDFIEARPDLVLNLEIHHEVLFEIGAGYIEQGRHDQYIQLLKRMRDEHVEAYIKSFGYYDRDLICDAVVKQNFHDISEYLKFFKEYPEDVPDNLFKVIDFLCAQNCQEIVTDLTKSIYKDVCNSKNIIGGDSILDQLIWSYFIPYLKPEYSDDDMVDLSNDLKTIEYELYEDFCKPENLKQNFSKIFSHPQLPDRKKIQNRKMLFEYYFAVTRNFAYFLNTTVGMDWMAAEFYRTRVFDYFSEAVPKGKLPKEIFIFTKNKIETALVRSSKDLFSLNSTMAFGMLNGIYWFADYLKLLEFIDQAKCENIHDWCRELFDQTYNILKKESFTAKAFKDFPLSF
jgi:hypothetical protein